MRASKQQCMWRPFVGAVAVGLFGFSIAYAGPRTDKASSTDSVQAVETRRVVEVQPPIEDPLAVPTALGDKANMLQPLPQGMPIVITEVHRDMRTGGGIASAGVANAAIFRDGGDSGFFIPIKHSDVGSFVAQQMIFGNGWSPGGSITGYSMTIFNSSLGPSGDMTVRTSLWDGDPFGIADTACSVGGVPAEIPGTAATFGPLADAFGNATGGGCAPLPLLTGPCVGLWKLTASFNKVQIFCDRAYMVKEALEGCRVGWRLAGNPLSLAHDGPDIGFGDLIELGYECGQFAECNTPTGRSVGTCCNTGALCDDSVTVDSCSHSSFCTAGVADTFDAFTFGAPTSGLWATFVSDVQAATDVTFSVRPNGVQDLVASKGGFTALMEFVVSDFDPGLSGIQLKAWQAKIEVAGFTSGQAGTITTSVVDCTAGGDADCAAAWGGIGTPGLGGVECGYGAFPNDCTPSFIDDQRGDYLFFGRPQLAACDQSNVRCGATLLGAGTVATTGGETYVMTIATDVPGDAKGTFTICPAVGEESLLDDQAQFVPLIGLICGTVTVETGQCCDLSSDPFVCIGDTFTANNCAFIGGSFSAGKTCADECGCTDDSQCGDGDACTVDTCDVGGTDACVNTKVAIASDECCDPTATRGDAADIGGTGAIASNNDGDQCTDDLCTLGGNRGAVDNPPSAAGTPCDDGSPCTYDDVCDGNDPPACTGLNVNDTDCSSEADCEAVTGSAFPCVGGKCLCVEEPPIKMVLSRTEKPNPECTSAGTKVTADIQLGASAATIAGGQFNVSWDPSCLSYNGISTVDPYTTVLANEADAAGGTLFWAVGVGFDPLTGAPLPGRPGSTSMGRLSFTKLPGCDSCLVCADAGSNPGDTLLTDDTGQFVGVDLSNSCNSVQGNAVVTLDVPDDDKVNTDCDQAFATVDVGTGSASASCGPVDLQCDTGGVQQLAVGTHQYCCTATSVKCGGSVQDCWTITVNDQQSLDLVVQLSPIIAASELHRCLTFELVADCVTGSSNNHTFRAEVWFGGPGNLLGHYKDSIKTPKSGNWVCMTARDQSHTLRSVAALDCVDGVYSATFKGDPFFFGGNWLTGGNLDGWKKENPNASHDVIDILDFGQFVWMWGQSKNPNSDCSDPAGPNCDIDGNGMCDLGDFNFIARNFLASSKGACCGAGGVAAEPLARTEISVLELRELGMTELIVADLNGDGLINMDDMDAFMNGQTPTKKPGRGVKGSSLRSSR